ncbi:hemerythrin domain-containing protein [Ramlibacter solisilvae]|uniref:Hemerythrin n=1 Tax=Ramlibacter tataouinensis TaxID=94132 RepID=A0A127K141_9BURK|nr:hemerythrin domain-containing protein [Ramlibacter tataouinensis]AMO24772.1 hemerythrin [Ramlibacter tataouinensis]
MSQVVGISPPGAKLAAGFEQPFEMLHACHERVERMLALLQRLREHVRAQGGDEQARQAARDVMRYFDTAAPKHHEDEELHVFPVLIALDDEAVAQVVAQLQQDHLQMERHWRAARGLLLELAEGHRAAFDRADEAVLDAFAGLYAGHIEAEESIAYPRAAALIEGERLQSMSRDMMARRGLVDSKR